MNIEPHFHQDLKNQPEPNSNASNNEGRGLSEEKIKGHRLAILVVDFPKKVIARKDHQVYSKP